MNPFQKINAFINKNKNRHIKNTNRQLKHFLSYPAHFVHSSKQHFFMSIHSQLLETISYSEDSLAKNHHQHLKCLHLEHQQKIHSTLQPKTNKLPLNLFLSPTEYHKMLITKGKSRKVNHSQIVNGQLLTLQYHNDPIFLKENLKKYTPSNTYKPQLNQSHQSTVQAKNIKHNHNSHSNSKKNKFINLSNSNMKKAQSTIQCDQLHSRKRSQSAGQKIKRKNSTIVKNSRKTNNSFNKSQNKKSIFQDDENAFYIPKKSKSHKNSDISHLIIKSLIDFNERKNAQKQNQTSIKKTKQQKQEYLKQLNQQIRVYNLHQSRISKSKSRQKSFTKQDLALDYWDHIKDQVLSSLKNDNYSQPLKQQLRNYNFNVYAHKELPKRKVQFSQRQINYLIKKHEKQAKSLIKHQQKQKKETSQKIQKNLRNLQKQRRKRIQSTLKKEFQPTAQMIRSAFQNIVEPSNLKHKQLSPNKKMGSIFQNQRINTKNGSNRPLI